MADLPKISALADLLLGGAPMIDLRAPSEFQKGSIPGAVSLPLMTDKERAMVGTCYKEQGQDAAIKLGHSLVSGAVKEARIQAWQQFAADNPGTVLFCLRGGLRSHITQGWLAEAGSPLPLVTGGYKALRRTLIEAIETIVPSQKSVIIGGRTGTNKTVLINSLSFGVDLEGLANHRGSSFGRPINDLQPTQISFENSLALQLMQLRSQQPEAVIFYEDESPRIGGLALPDSLNQTIRTQPMVLVEEPLEVRIEVIERDYITSRLAEFLAADPEKGFDGFRAYLLTALARVKKRLGGARYQAMVQVMEDSLADQEKTGDATSHRRWIKELLVAYYDPMYDYQLSKKENPIAFKGNGAAVLDWCSEKQS